jgi:energy-coupling factor transporter transmembrane protein EcfT
MPFGTILIVIFIFIMLGGGGGYYYGGGYPHAFGSGLGTVLLVLLVLWFFGVFQRSG